MGEDADDDDDDEDGGGELVWIQHLEEMHVQSTKERGNALAATVTSARGVLSTKHPPASADAQADIQTQLQTPKIPIHTPPAATSEAVTSTMEGASVPPKPLLPKALSIDFPGGMYENRKALMEYVVNLVKCAPAQKRTAVSRIPTEVADSSAQHSSVDISAPMDASSPRLFDSTPAAVPAATDINPPMAERESETPTADTPAFEFPNSPGTSGNVTPAPFEQFNFDVAASF